MKKEIVLSTPPNWLTIAIANKCMNKCQFCAYHSDDAKNKSNVYNIPFELSLDDFKKMVDLAKKSSIPKIHICATGEPFMHRDILAMIDYVGDVYGSVSVQTAFCKTLFDKYGFINEIINRKQKISSITTDILSGDPEQHNSIKIGSEYNDILDALEIICNSTNIIINICWIVTKINYTTIPMLIDDLVRRKIVNVVINIYNIFTYDFNQITSSESLYTSNDVDITKELVKAKKYGKELGIQVNIPRPADENCEGCTVFWDKVQTWPVKGIDPKRLHENLVPHACRAVVRGELNSLGYIFDYDNLMDFWNNEKIVSIRKNLIDGIYPSKECEKCYLYIAKENVEKQKKNWIDSAESFRKKFVSSEIVESLNDKSVCIDAGANVGDIANVFVSSGATVYCFEPHPDAFRELQSRFAGNNKVVMINKAVSDQNTMMKLYMHHYSEDDNVFWSQGASLIKSKNDLDITKCIDVEVVDLVEYIKLLDIRIDVLKLDIEGMEYDVLIKLIDTGVYKKIKHILVETHDRRIISLKDKRTIVERLIAENNIKNIDLTWV